MFSSPTIPACHCKPHFLTSAGEISIFNPLWMVKSDNLKLDGSKRGGQFAGIG
jgi:hypothetical protein